MENRKFKRAARINRAKAFLFTFLFHVIVIGSLMNDSAYQKMAQLLPDTVVEWLGIDQEVAIEKEDDDTLQRP